MHISIVIPMHDEEEALDALLPALERAYVEMTPRRTFEAVLVDDGSKDGTWDKAWQWAERTHFPVKVIRQNPCEGIGSALRTGFEICLGDVVVTYDADMSYPLSHVERLVEAVEAGADVVTASPFHPEGTVGGVPGGRHFVSRAATGVYRLRLGRRAGGLTCLTCGFRAYRRSVLPDIIPRHDGFLATAELLVKSLRAGLNVVEVPSDLGPRTAGRSKMKTGRTALSHLAFLVACR